MDGQIAQKTEDKIGKYDLNDFFLYYTLRHGFEPSRSAAFAMHAYPELTKDEGRAVLDGLETALVEARLSADADTLDFILHADGGDPERRQEQAAWLTERVSCQWQGRRFVRK